MIPCCFHPTRIVIVNDCHELMVSLNDQLSQSHMTLNTFENPHQALHYINEVYQLEPFYDRYQHMKEDRTRSNASIKTNVVDTHYEIYRPQRFDEISTVVIDLSPISDESGKTTDMNGLEFFEKIQNPHVQKILLIRERDHELAIDALNKGLIHDYICRDELDWQEEFYEKAQESQWRYFNKLSEIFFEKVRSGSVNEYALNDPNFQKLFKSILTNYGFTEAYLCETTGSYLFLDGQAQDHGLVVNLADQLDSWVRNGQAKGINIPLLKDLKDRKKMMCYHNSANSVEPDKSHWEIYAHPVKTIKGKSGTYYYAFAPNVYDIDVERVLPFEEYRESQIAAKITPRTKAIMPVHFAGLPVDLDPLYDLAKKHNLRVIEDAAHAIGTEYKGRRIGSFGDIQVFSFHPNKNMTTGEGGCITTRDDDLAKQLMLLRFHGMDREAWNRFGKSGSQHYEIICPGHKANMMDIQAAIGIHQLKSLNSFIERRTELVMRYQAGLKNSDLTLPVDAPYPHHHAWHIFAPLVNRLDRDDVMQALKERNIGTGLHYRAAHLYPFYRKTYGWKVGDFPNAETIGNRIFSLPLYPQLTNDDQDLIIEILHEILK